MLELTLTFNIIYFINKYIHELYFCVFEFKQNVALRRDTGECSELLDSP